MNMSITANITYEKINKHVPYFFALKDRMSFPNKAH